MSYAVLMAYVDANSMPEQRVRLAASLAEKFNATLIGLSALAIHPPFLIEGVAIPQATAVDIVEIMSMLTAKGDWFRNIAAIDHHRIEWRPLGQWVVPPRVRCRRCLHELQELFAPMAAFPLQLTLNSVLADEEIMTTPGHSSNLLLANSQVRRGP
jgi:hypothetical protein